MGQTLTHGVYLPDEGERNCYNGLASNWSILDGAVGTIAEHTTALAGKAPAVHTHVKADITDFPAYGNTAGTICEGNDSRLSDARTPVAHTHTKSDVTDLFNSANTWTNYNVFSGSTRPIRLQSSDNDIYNVSPQSSLTTLIDFVDKDNISMSYICFQHRSDAPETHRLCLRQNKITSDSYYSVNLNNLGDFYPEQNSTINLGKADRQWNNVYAKSYYYNGTAWGLDKANVWSADNIYTYAISLKQTNLEKGELPVSNQTRRYRFPDKNNSDLGWLQHRVSTSGDSYLECLVANKFSNGQLSTQGNEIINSLVLGLSGDGSRYLKVLGDVYPDLPTRVCNLGTSTNKWKTINGINPGALSLPTTDSTKWVDLSGSISAAPTKYTYTPAVDGWISVMIKRSGGDCAVFLIQGNISNACYNKDSPLVGETAAFASVCIPVRAGVGADIHIKGSGTTIESAYFIPCQGNV